MSFPSDPPAFWALSLAWTPLTPCCVAAYVDPFDFSLSSKQYKTILHHSMNHFPNAFPSHPHEPFVFPEIPFHPAWPLYYWRGWFEKLDEIEGGYGFTKGKRIERGMVLEWEEMVLSRLRSLIGRKGEGPIKGE